MSRSLSGFAVVVVLISLPFLGWGAWEQWFQHSNKEIASELPAYPGARLISQSEGGGSLNLAFVLPRGTSPAEVEAFYRGRLSRAWDLPDRDCDGFTRGNDLILLLVDSSDYRTLRVLIHTDGADHCETYWSVMHT